MEEIFTSHNIHIDIANYVERQIKMKIKLKMNTKHNSLSNLSISAFSHRFAHSNYIWSITNFSIYWLYLPNKRALKSTIKSKLKKLPWSILYWRVLHTLSSAHSWPNPNGGGLQIWNQSPFLIPSMATSLSSNGLGNIQHRLSSGDGSISYKPCWIATAFWVS